MEIILRLIKGEKISELAAEYGVSRNSIYLWRKLLVNRNFRWKSLKKSLAELNIADKIKIINQLKSDYTVTEL